MSKLIYIALFSIVLVGCVQDQPAENDPFIENGEGQSMENRIAQLELDNALKDSLINESLAFFNEIKSNLEKIGIRKDQIRAVSDNNEISGDDKSWIIEEIQHINYLREENANKVRRMQKQMKENGLKIKELEF